MTVPPAMLSALILSSVHFALLLSPDLYTNNTGIVLSLLVTFGVMVCNAYQADKDPEGHTKNVEIAVAVIAGLAILNISRILYKGVDEINKLIKDTDNMNILDVPRRLVVVYFILTIVAFEGHKAS